MSFKTVLWLIGVGWAGIAIYLVTALGLLFSQWPGEVVSSSGLHFNRLDKEDNASDIPLTRYETRNGSHLNIRYYKSSKGSAPLVILIHGSGWHGGSYLGLAKALSDEADVIVPDLRGHGVAPKRRGDVDYLGQYEDDIADLIKRYRKKGQKLILTGHSSGGGLVIRYAGGKYGKELDGAILIAPYLQYNAPTLRPNSGGWAFPITRRIIGLSMLNAIGISQFNNFTVVQFKFPSDVLNGKEGRTATQAYSYRLIQSYSPRRDYLKDIASLPAFLLIAGKEDEAFLADKYKPTMSAVSSRGEYLVLDGFSHLDVFSSAPAKQAMIKFIQSM
ncbi:MAG: alpha/beta hydrolase [Methyloligellaceae bacterium]